MYTERLVIAACPISQPRWGLGRSLLQGCLWLVLGCGTEADSGNNLDSGGSSLGGLDAALDEQLASDAAAPEAGPSGADAGPAATHDANTSDGSASTARVT